MDTTTLEAAYRTLLDLAGTGRFRAPAAREAWTADQRLAAVLANDRLLAATTADVLAGRPAAYDSSVAGDATYLGAIGRAAGGHEALVAAVRQSGLELVLLARQLDEAGATTAVPTRIVEGDLVRVDAPLPWVATLKTHAEVHLPGHIDALRALSR